MLKKTKTKSRSEERKKNKKSTLNDDFRHSGKRTEMVQKPSDEVNDNASASCCIIKKMNLMPNNRCLCGDRFDEFFLESPSAPEVEIIDSVLAPLGADIKNQISEFLPPADFSSTRDIVRRFDLQISCPEVPDVNPNRLHFDRVKRKGNKKSKTKKQLTRDAWNAEASKPMAPSEYEELKKRKSHLSKADKKRAAQKRLPWKIQSGSAQEIALDYFDIGHKMILLIEDCSVDTSFAHLYCAFSRYLSSINRDVTKDLIDYAVSRIKSSIKVQGDEGDSNIFVQIQRLIGGSSSIISSEFAREVYAFLQQTLSLSFFARRGFKINDPTMKSRLESWFGTLNYECDLWNLQVMEAITTFTSHLIRRFNIFMTSGSVIEAFGTESESRTWIKRCEEAFLKLDYINDPAMAFQEKIVQEAFNVFTLKTDFEDLIRESAAIGAVTEKGPWGERNTIKKYVQRLRDGQVLIMRAIKAFGTRKAPFGVLLFGKTAQMKSTLTSWIFNQFADAVKDIVPLKRDFSMYSYVKNPSDPRWDNFKSEKWAIILDDLSIQKPEASNGVPEDLNVALRVQNNVPYIPEQAALEDKGQTPLNNYLTIGTTNLDHMNVTHYFTNCHAQMRRWDVKLEVVLKKAYSLPNGMVDKSAIPPHISQYDLWDFTLFDFDPVGQSLRRRDIKKFSSIRDLGIYLRQLFRVHVKQQFHVVEVGRQMDRSSICEKCAAMFSPGEMCPFCHPGGLLHCCITCNGYIEDGVQCEPCASNLEQSVHVQGAYQCEECMQSHLECVCKSDLVKKCEFPEGGGVIRPPGGGVWWDTVPMPEATYKERIADFSTSCSVTVMYIWYNILAFSIILGEPIGRRIMNTLYWCQLKILKMRDFVKHKRLHMIADGTTWYWEALSFVPVFACNLIAGSLDNLAWVIAAASPNGVKHQRRLLRVLIWLNRFRNWTLAWCAKCCINKVSTRVRIWRRNYGSVAQQLGKLLPGATILVAMYSIYRKFSTPAKDKHTTQSGVEGRIPEPTEERETVWFNGDPSLHHSSFSHKVLTSGNMSKEAFLNLIDKHVFKGNLINQANMMKKELRALCIGSDMFVTNHHHFVNAGEGYDMLELSNANSNIGVRPIHRVKIADLRMFVYEKQDIVFFRLKSFATLPDLTDHFMIDYVSQTFNTAMYVDRSPLGTLITNELSNVTYHDTPPEIAKHFPTMHVSSKLILAHANSETVDGQCGMPMILKADDVGWVISGYHFASRDDVSRPKVLAWPILQRHVKAAFDALGCGVKGAGPFLKKGDSEVHVQHSLHRKSPLLYMEEGSAIMLGSLEVHRRTMKSRVRKTFIHDEILALPFPVPFTSQHGPPVMRGWAPKRQALKEILESKPAIPANILRSAVDSFVHDILCALPASELDLLEVYMNPVVVNGHADVTYVDGIKRSTSAGFPYYHTKKLLLHDVEPASYAPNPVDFDDEVWDRVRIMEQQCCTNQRTGAIFTAQLKDEPVSHKKIEAKKTRVFSAAPVDLLLLMRKFTLSFIRVLQRNRYVFESGPGTIVQSSEWGTLYEYLTAFGDDRIIAGDYAAFDKSMPAEFILAAFEIIRRVCEAGPNYPREGLQVIDSLAHDIAFPYTDFFGDLTMFIGSNPSGHPLTAIVNGLVNSLYMRCAYYMLNPAKEVKSFKNSVHLFTYGDDNIMGVSRETPWFNHTSIARCFAQFGITYTMADKEAVSVPFISILDATFLKRGFRYDDDVRAWVAPLEFKSLCKSLLWHVHKPANSRGYLALESLRNVMREFFFYGRTTFESNRVVFLRLEDKLFEFIPLGYDDTTLDAFLPRWDEELDRFQASSRKIERRRAVRVQNGRSCLYYHINGEAILGNIPRRSKAERAKGRVSESERGVVYTKFGSFYHSLKRIAQLRETSSASSRRAGALRRVKYAPSEEHSATMGNSASTKSTPTEVVPNDPHETTHDEAVGSGPTTFMEATPNNVLEFGPLEDPTFSADALDGVGLQDFLSRPVKITEFGWTQGFTASFYFDPWTMFFSNAVIKRKLDNYGFIQCNLHIKVVMNTSPFYFGCLRLSYDPAHEFWLSDIPVGANELMITSQRPGFNLFPSCCEGGEMTLPFMWPEDWLDITDAAALARMGRLRFTEFVGLQHANGLSSTSMDVSVYAWATNVKLSGPTYKLAIQSGKAKPIRTSGKKNKKDEYTISNVATAVANFSGSLVQMPVISPFARATQIGASAVASIASMFGFSKVPELGAPKGMRNIPLGHFATSETGVPSMKLALDPKNELSIDPRTVGLPGGDELNICSMVCRESYLTAFSVQSTTAAGELLCQIPITPNLAYKVAGINQELMNMTPMALISQHFKYWRGDIRIRLRAVCTKFHKARFRVHWDPLYAASGSTDITPSSFTKILDLSPEMDAEFEVSYNQARHWLLTQSAADGVFPKVHTGSSIGSPYTFVDQRWNGMLTISLLNVLSNPGSSTAVSVMVSIAGTPSLEFAFPTSHADERWSYFTVQSGEACSMNKGGDSPDSDAYAVYHGEVVRSMRTLLHRTTRSAPIAFDSTTTTAISLFARFTQPMYPPFHGYDPNGFHRVMDAFFAAVVPFNRESPSAYQLLAPCFVGMRGSIQWHFSVVDMEDHANLFVVGRVERAYYTDALAKPRYDNSGFDGVTDPSVLEQVDLFETRDYKSGYEATLIKVMPTMTLSVPFYSRYRFAATKPDTITSTTILDTDLRKLAGYVGTKRVVPESYFPANTMVHRNYEMGPDFTLFFFHSVPTVYVYSDFPTSREYQ